MSRFKLPEQDPEQAHKSVDEQALQRFAAGAETHAADEQAPPWESHDPKAAPRHNATVRMNDYHLAMMRYLAAELDTSQQKILRRILLPAIEQRARAMFEQKGSPSDQGLDQ